MITKDRVLNLHKSTTMRFSGTTKAVLVALVGASSQLQDAMMRWWGIEKSDAMLIMLVVSAVVSGLGMAGTAKGYLDSSNKKPVEER